MAAKGRSVPVSPIKSIISKGRSQEVAKTLGRKRVENVLTTAVGSHYHGQLHPTLLAPLKMNLFESWQPGHEPNEVGRPTRSPNQGIETLSGVISYDDPQSTARRKLTASPIASSPDFPPAISGL